MFAMLFMSATVTAEEHDTPNFTSLASIALHVSPVPQRLSAQVFHVGVPSPTTMFVLDNFVFINDKLGSGEKPPLVTCILAV